VELVYIILKGVTKFSKEAKKVADGKLRSRDSKIKRRVAKSTLTLNHVEIDDPKLWDVLKMEDFVSNDGSQEGAELMQQKKREASDICGDKQKIE